MATVVTARVAPAVERVYSIDVLRGLVMVVMALDHTRDFYTGAPFEPEDLARTDLALFLTRWITHFCAPAFALLAGTGAYLAATRGLSRAELSTKLRKRGLFVALLDPTIAAVGWTFLTPLPAGLVLWMLGLSMVALSWLVRWPVRWIALFGLAMIALHDLADPINAASLGQIGGAIWKVLHVQGFIWLVPGKIPLWVVVYPLVPWIGVMAVGYALGASFERPPRERQRVFLLVGAAATIAFVALRATHAYGNPPAGLTFGLPLSNGPFVVQPTAAKTVISFLNVQKYPPSLQFLLMTLGPSLMLLAWLDRRFTDARPGRASAILLVYGRVPMFYYLAHIYLIHAIAVVVALAFRQPVLWLVTGGFLLNNRPPGYGHHLPFIYLMWILVVAMLFPLCRWFADVKRRRRDWWLRYV